MRWAIVGVIGVLAVSCGLVASGVKGQKSDTLEIPKTLKRFVIGNNLSDDLLVCTESRRDDVILGCTTVGQLRAIHGLKGRVVVP